ncbi:hypothetical protein LPB140_06945 [Sphingorhabdus lutea]|uniref:PepSY domain-containing protein n=2 Tax=Sphingorhabdus lutea TaxID=1913578 RepID=A0A1L3JBP6_9SPHN|nr:hypothetical protein LPB140_06945 [Sphingorhabdus lutea]
MWAGLFLIPFIILLSLTGSIYLFKPQLDRWEERDMRGLNTENSVSAEAQLSVVMKQYPDAQFHSYRLPENKGDAAMVHVALPHNGGMRDIYVSPAGDIIASHDPEKRISATVARIHGSLLLGKFGSILVEIAAIFAIMMILSGIYLWWPRTAGRHQHYAGILWPRLKNGVRIFWRDLHAVTGFWVAGLALILLFSGLPWTDNVGAGIKYIRAQMGWVDAKPQNWSGGGIKENVDMHVDAHGGHDHDAMLKAQAEAKKIRDLPPKKGLNDIVILASKENMPFPAIIQPPHAPARFGPPNGDVWKLSSEAQNRTLNRTILYDKNSGAIVKESSFADKHIADKIINYGIAWHEGQLFGWINQLIGLFTALALITISISGIKMWWRKRPKSK